MSMSANLKGALFISLGYLAMLVVFVAAAFYLHKYKEEHKDDTKNKTNQYDLVGRIIDAIFKDGL